MPQLYGGDRLERYFVSAEEVLRTLSSRYALTPRRSSESTTESLYALEGCGDTALGIISAMSEPFCHRCNKVRLLPDGSLRTCLYGGSGINLKDLLRSGASPSSIVREIRSMVAEKPWSMSREPEKLAMHRTGG
jgi:cyclic pyranopterin phosphate synthase